MENAGDGRCVVRTPSDTYAVAVDDEPWVGRGTVMSGVASRSETPNEQMES